MKRFAVWIVGEPGAGKTVIARALLRPHGCAPFVNGRVKWTVGDGICAAGTYSGAAFDGADTVPYDGARPCLEFWRDALSRKEVTILDGDRFSNAMAVAFMREQPGVVPVCIYVTSDRAAERRAARSHAVQNATWVKGRSSKARNFYEGFYGQRLTIKSDGMTPDDCAAAVRSFLGTL